MIRSFIKVIVGLLLMTSGFVLRLPIVSLYFSALDDATVNLIIAIAAVVLMFGGFVMVVIGMGQFSVRTVKTVIWLIRMPFASSRSSQQPNG